MVRWLSLFAVALVFASLASACGGSKASQNGSGLTANSTSHNGAPASDEAYLNVICSGTDNFLHAVNTSTTASGISAAIKDFITRLRSINPPSDLRAYNQSFIKYLQDSVANPTSLLTTNPPLPPKKARDRLVSKESSVESCAKPTFLDAGNPPGVHPTP